MERYNIAETFISLKGEGIYTGRAMFFIRFAGCNLNCSFCDTDHSVRKAMYRDELVLLAEESGCQHVVLTGGEPLMLGEQLLPLLEDLHHAGHRLHLETNGTYPLTELPFDWVACCPKSPIDQLCIHTISSADEVKFLVGAAGWRAYIDEVVRAAKLGEHSELLVMPLAKSKHDEGRSPADLIDENVQLAVQFCLENKQFSLCMQMHKILSIR
jgi:7-carboxy-7-deazaguanine synthase